MTGRIGIDLGGTKIEALAIDAAGRTLARRRIATPRASYEASIAALGQLVADIEREVGGRCSVGVGMPGAVSPATGLMKNANSTWLNGRAFVADLEGELARPVRVANDADCFALSEASDGAGADAATVFGVIIGTGTGGGIVVHRRLLRGPNAIAGEWGHNMLPWPRDGEWPGPPCYCGRSGCLETFLSGPGFEHDYAQQTGAHVGSQEVCRRAGEGETAAAAVLTRYIDRLARGLASVINVLDPEVIVLGGGMSNIAALYDETPKRWSEWVFSDRVDTRLVPARHGDSSGVRGAAWLWSPEEVSARQGG
jgi:fructokinase